MARSRACKARLPADGSRSLHITRDEFKIVSKELIGEDTYISKSFMALFTIGINFRIRAGGTGDVDA